MKFSVGTEITSYATFRDFVAAETLTAEDLILVNESIYRPFVEPCQLPCQILFQKPFGSGEPHDQMIDAVRAAVPETIRRIIAIGGGTIIDIAKILVFGGAFTTEQLFTGQVVPPRIRQLMVIPTTCGTGSEVTNLSIVELKAQKTKKGLGLPAMLPDRAVLIPELVAQLPYHFFATSSIDALIHAVESMVSPRSGPHTEVLARQAITLIIRGYQATVALGPESWAQWAGDFQIASNFAGIAFGNAGVGAVHALSYPLGGTYHIAHGEANQLMFMAVFQAYRTKKPAGKINEIEQLLADLLHVTPAKSFAALDSLLQQILPRQKLQAYGVSDQDLVTFSRAVVTGQQRLLANNYVALTEAEILQIYHSVHA